MNKKLIATLAGALVLPASMVAMGATDYSIYGRVVAGLDWQDSDKAGESATWDLGATGKNGNGNQQSRLGFKADRDLGNGLSAGFKLEQGFNADDGPNNQRHRYVYLSGGFGTVTIGNQNNPYLMGANWSQEWYLGGNTVGSFREEGIGYSNSWGAFSLGVLLTGDNGNAATTPITRIADTRTDLTQGSVTPETDGALIARLTADGVPGSGGDTLIRVSNPTASGSTAYVPETPAERATRLLAANAAAAAANERVADETIDKTIIGASYDFGVAKVGVGYNGDNTDSGYDWTSIGVSGSLDAFGYYVGYQTKDDARPDSEEDVSGWGTFLYYDASEADRLYLEYEAEEDDFGADNERTYTILGYSHNFGAGTRFIGEYRTTDDDGNDEEPSRLALTMMVSF